MQALATTRYGLVAFGYEGPSRTFRFPVRALVPGVYEVRLTLPAATGIERTHSAPFAIPRR